MAIAVVVVAALLLAMSPTPIEGKYLEGVVDTSKDMEFLARFVFEPEELGQLWYEFKYPATLCCYQLLLFNDDPLQWPYVRANYDKLTCLEKKAQIPSNYNGIMTLSTPYNCKNVTEDGQEMLVCSGTRHFVTSRPRWWFINVANCNNMSPQEGIHIQYRLNMTNGVHPMDKHFSADERYTLQTSIGFSVLYFLMALTGVYYKFQLSKKKLLHSTYQLFFTSVCLQLAALIFTVIALANFAVEGIEMPALKMAGQVISSIGDVLFVLMLMLVGKGYTITRGRISTSGSVKLAIFICLYSLTYVFLYTYAEMTFDPRDVIFMYDSPSGMGLIVLRVVGMVWLYYCVFFTIKNFNQKLKFYVLFLLFFAAWFVAEPIMIGVANAYIPKYTRAKIVAGVYWTTTFLGHMIFLVLTRPDRTNEYFPYHIKTNQVAAMLVDEDDVESDFPNPFIGEPLTRSLTNIFVNTPTPKVTVPAPYNVPETSSQPSRPGEPKINNFVSVSLHAVSATNSAHDEVVNEAPQPPKPTPKPGPNYAMFCVEKPKPTPTATVTHENEKQPTPASKGPSPPKKRKGKKIKPQQAVAKRSATGTATAEVPPPGPAGPGRKTKNPTNIQGAWADSDFVEIPLDDLTITDV